MIILITGVNGFIGRKLTASLEAEHVIYGVTSRTKEDFVGVQQWVGDLTDLKKVKEMTRQWKNKVKIDAMVHLASRMMSPANTHDMTVFYDNLKMAESVIAMATELKPIKLINISSMTVYPNKDGVYTENSPVETSGNSDCLYGLSKVCQENMFDFYLKNVQVAHLRVAQVYGEGMRQDRIIPVMQNELTKKNTITVYGNGERSSCFIEVNQVAEVIRFFLENDVTGVYNVGQESMTFLDLAKKIIQQKGNAQSQIIRLSEGNRSKFVLDCSKLDRLLNQTVSSKRF